MIQIIAKAKKLESPMTEAGMINKLLHHVSKRFDIALVKWENIENNKDLDIHKNSNF